MSMLEDWENTAALQGFRVHFELREDGVLASDYMPERDEAPIPTLDVAWEIARRMDEFAPGHIVNIYVIDLKWRPVTGYDSKRLRRYPAG